MIEGENNPGLTLDKLIFKLLEIKINYGGEYKVDILIEHNNCQHEEPAGGTAVSSSYKKGAKEASSRRIKIYCVNFK